MTNLDVVKEQLNKMSAKEMAVIINTADLDVGDACDYCVYKKYECIEDCEWGIEKYLKKAAKNNEARTNK